MADLGDALKSVLQVPGLQELLNNDITQQRQMAPVRSGIAQQAANMLPNSAYPGGRPNMAAIAPATYSTGAPSGGSDLAKTLALLGGGAGIGAALAKLLGGGGGSGAGGDIGKLLSSLFKRNGMNYPNSPGTGFGGDHTTTVGSRDPFGGNLPSYQDPFGTLFGNGGGIPTSSDFSPNDPSGGTGIGPGMQSFYADPGSGGGTVTGTDPWDE